MDFILVDVIRQSYSFLCFCVPSGIWSYCEALVFRGAYLFDSFSFAKNVTSRNVWLFWDNHALSLFCIQLKSFVFTLDCDCCIDSKSAISTVSSPYLRLFMLLPPTLTHGALCSVEYFAADIEEAWRKNAALSHFPTDRFVHTAVIINSYHRFLFPVQVSDGSKISSITVMS